MIMGDDMVLGHCCAGRSWARVARHREQKFHDSQGPTFWAPAAAIPSTLSTPLAQVARDLEVSRKSFCNDSVPDFRSG